MQKQKRFNFSPIHMNLLEQFQNLFNRQNLCSNNYLYRQINNALQIPFNFITQQRKIAQITSNKQTIQQALEMCNLVQIIDSKTVKIIQYPTLKISTQYKTNIYQFCQILKQKNKKIIIYEQDSLIYLSLIEKKHAKELQTSLNQFNKTIQFKVADLQSDWKIGTAKIRKLKQQNKKNYKSQKYSFDKPPGIFIRRAVESSDEQQQNIPAIKFKNNKKQSQKQKQKKYREKSIINQQDFPTLA